MNDSFELPLCVGDNKPSFRVKRWAKRHVDTVETPTDFAVLDVADSASPEEVASGSLSSNEWLVVSPTKSDVSSHHPDC